MSESAWLSDLLKSTSAQSRPASLKDADKQSFQAFLNGNEGSKTTFSTPGPRPGSTASSRHHTPALTINPLRGMPSPASLGKSALEQSGLGSVSTHLGASKISDMSRDALIQELETCQQELRTSRKCTAQAMEAWRNSETNTREAQDASMDAGSRMTQLEKEAREDRERAEVNIPLMSLVGSEFEL